MPMLARCFREQFHQSVIIARPVRCAIQWIDDLGRPVLAVASHANSLRWGSLADRDR